jgi:hypothetical protein
MSDLSSSGGMRARPDNAMAMFRPGLDVKFQPQIPLCKKKILITLKYRYMHRVLNVDEIKN